MLIYSFLILFSYIYSYNQFNLNIFSDARILVAEMQEDCFARTGTKTSNRNCSYGPEEASEYYKLEIQVGKQ